MKPTRLIAAMNLTKPIFAEVLIASAHLFEANAAEYMFFMFGKYYDEQRLSKRTYWVNVYTSLEVYFI